jgi:hypothetical protein
LRQASAIQAHALAEDARFTARQFEKLYEEVTRR